MSTSPLAGSDYPLPPLGLVLPPPLPRRAAVGPAVSGNGGPLTSHQDGQQPDLYRKGS
jgi:hypothetical protein